MRQICQAKPGIIDEGVFKKERIEIAKTPEEMCGEPAVDKAVPDIAPPEGLNIKVPVIWLCAMHWDWWINTQRRFREYLQNRQLDEVE